SDLGGGSVDFSVTTNTPSESFTSDHAVLEATGLPTYVVNVTSDTTRCDDPSFPAPSPAPTPTPAPTGGAQCTLRGAITAANASPGRDASGLAIPGTPSFSTHPSGQPPTTTHPVAIDALNQHDSQ